MVINSSQSQQPLDQTTDSTKWMNSQRKKNKLRLFCLLTLVILNYQSMLWSSPKIIKKLSMKNISDNLDAKILINLCSNSMQNYLRKLILIWNCQSCKAKKLCLSSLKILKNKEKCSQAINNMTLILTAYSRKMISPIQWPEDSSSNFQSLSLTKCQSSLNKLKKKWMNLLSKLITLNSLVVDQEFPASFNLYHLPSELNHQELLTQVNVSPEELHCAQPCTVAFSESNNTIASMFHQLDFTVPGKEKMKKCRMKVTKLWSLIKTKLF